MKKYTLKPGRHQFAPGSPAVHSNDTLTDEEAKWYIQRYPHIAKLFVAVPKRRAKRIRIPAQKQPVQSPKISEIQE